MAMTPRDSMERVVEASSRLLEASRRKRRRSAPQAISAAAERRRLALAQTFLRCRDYFMMVSAGLDAHAADWRAAASGLLTICVSPHFGAEAEITMITRRRRIQLRQTSRCLWQSAHHRIQPTEH